MGFGSYTQIPCFTTFLEDRCSTNYANFYTSQEKVNSKEDNTEAYYNDLVGIHYLRVYQRQIYCS